MERKLPSYPLFVKDPNFSLWQGGEILNEQNAETWFGEKKNIYGFLKAEGETYCFMGDCGDFSSLGVKKAEQTELNVAAFSTDYVFKCGNATLKLSFVSPLPLTDFELLSLPVCYVKYELLGVKNAEISLFVNRNIAYNVGAKLSNGLVRGGVVKQDGFESAFLGLARQFPFSNTGDRIGADWGYWYVGGEESFFFDEKGVCGYLTSGLRSAFVKGEERYIAAINSSLSGVLLLGYDDQVSIDYFGEYRKGYYLENHSLSEGLNYVWKNFGEIEKTLSAFEKGLFEKAEPFGEAYRNILIAALRQSIAAHKLVRDDKGEILWLSKECDSNGCIGTVDVSYPSIPLYLLYNPELVKGMMRPILKFSRMPVWTYDFAPHDVGTYPVCCGQVYGLKQEPGNKYHGAYIDGDGRDWQTHFPIYTLPASFEAFNFKQQMPVEESANMLVMFLAVYRADKDIAFFEENADILEKWVEYLVKYGLKPANQLCTDDFAGHLANNVNLAIKATVGIAAYAELLSVVGNEKWKEYRKIAETFAREISKFAEGKSHIPLTWDSDETTFSLKYNFAFDKILKLGLFEQSLFEKEVDCYLSVCEEYGTPLDSRKTYTKSDWIVWVTSLSDDREKQKKMLAPLDKYLKESPCRIPFGDWYETLDGKPVHFRARSVQGGCFILLL